MGFPKYGCISGGINSVSYGMTCGTIWGGVLYARPGFMVRISLVITLSSGSGARFGGAVVVGCYIVTPL